MLSVSFLFGLLGGFLTFFLASHPEHPRSLKKKLPYFKLRWLEVSPQTQGAILKLQLWSYQLHLHHWFTVLLLYLLVGLSPIDLTNLHRTFHGFVFGAVFQGLTYPDRFRLVIRKRS